MKNIYLLIILISFGLQAQEINWISFPEALEAQKKEPKKTDERNLDQRTPNQNNPDQKKGKNQRKKNDGPL